MPVEAFWFDEKARIREIGIQYSYTIERIEGCNEVVVGFFDGLQVTGRDVTGGSDESEVV
jgi:hypothetical protein